MRKLAVLVLAAGKSSRMKSIKQLEKINDKTLLDITLDKVKQLAVKDIFCVLGANAEIIKENITTKNIPFIHNINFETGLSSSIVAGIKHLQKEKLEFDGVFILLADQPAIEIKYLQVLVHAFYQHKRQIIASKYGENFGVPAIIPAINFDDLINLKGDKGAKEFLHINSKFVNTVDYDCNLLDIDTQQDLNSYKNQFN